MPKPKEENIEGKPAHFLVGALIKKDGKYLLIDRADPPFGFAVIAGHIDEGETPEEALKREVMEETGLKAENLKFISEEFLDWNWCGMGMGSHYWYVYECEVSGDVELNPEEVKKIGWYTKDEIKQLNLEPSWEYWFKKLKIT